MIIDGNEIPMYVGRSVNPERRMRQHLYERLHSPQQWKYEWWNNPANGEPDSYTYEILAECVLEDENAEDKWIRRLICDGCPLQNMRAGTAWSQLTFTEFMQWRTANGKPMATVQQFLRWKKSLKERQGEYRADDIIDLDEDEAYSQLRSYTGCPGELERFVIEVCEAAENNPALLDDKGITVELIKRFYEPYIMAQ